MAVTNEVPAKTSGRDRLRDYLRETRAELRKVVWPTREETLNLTGVVLLVTLAMTVFLGGLDSIFSALLNLLLEAAQNIG
jgi:preprotein translocase subunit SecE